jgi:hypothetical protein
MQTTEMVSPLGDLRAAMRLAGAFTVAAALSSGAAWAQNAASCKQEYATKKAAGETGGQSQASYVKGCIASYKARPTPPAQGGTPGDATAGQSGSDSSADLAKQLANPVANLISVPLQSNLRAVQFSKL